MIPMSPITESEQEILTHVKPKPQSCLSTYSFVKGGLYNIITLDLQVPHTHNTPTRKGVDNTERLDSSSVALNIGVRTSAY